LARGLGGLNEANLQDALYEGWVASLSKTFIISIRDRFIAANLRKAAMNEAEQNSKSYII